MQYVNTAPSKGRCHQYNKHRYQHQYQHEHGQNTLRHNTLSSSLMIRLSSALAFFSESNRLFSTNRGSFSGSPSVTRTIHLSFPTTLRVPTPPIPSAPPSILSDANVLSPSVWPRKRSYVSNGVPPSSSSANRRTRMAFAENGPHLKRIILQYGSAIEL